MTGAEQKSEQVAEWWINAFERWWDETSNPLHVWQAISVCTTSNPAVPLPTWCIAYLAKSAQNIDALIRGLDFQNMQIQVSPDDAYDLALKALAINNGKGKANAFTKLAHQRKDQELNIKLDMGHDPVHAIKQSRGVDDDHAKRLASQKRKKPSDVKR